MLRSMPPGLRCQEKLRLVLEYQKLTKDYFAAIGKTVMRGIPESEYDHLSRETEKARQRSIAARHGLARHIVEHGCHKSN